MWDSQALAFTDFPTFGWGLSLRRVATVPGWFALADFPALGRGLSLRRFLDEVSVRSRAISPPSGGDFH